MLRISRFLVQNFKSNSRNCSSFSSLIDIQPEILNAIKNKNAVVALESTIITHGMPYPYNLETAIEVEEIIRAEKAIPATIAIVNGRIKVGLTKTEIKTLAQNAEHVGNHPKHDNNQKTVKVSRRDLAYVLSKKWNGGTTVAGTLIIANMVGIKIFATGGIGGVHRDGENSMDVSADLMELGKCPVAVVSAGVKSILDIPRTLEYLETQGVIVASYQSPDHEFPAFYTRISGSKVPYNLENAQEAAALIASSVDLNLNSGILIGVPVPEKHAMKEEDIKAAIEDALMAARNKGVTGKEVTPFILSAVSKITEGRSLKTNIALIKNNARVAAQIAIALSNIDKLKPSLRTTSSAFNFPTSTQSNINKNQTKNVPVVVGGSNLDTCITVDGDDLKLDGATYQSKVEIMCGGVGRNIAEGIHKLNGDVFLITAVGDDHYGKFLRNSFPPNSYVVQTKKYASASCAVILDSSGDCRLIAGDMSAHREIGPDIILKNEDRISQCPMVVMDSNIPLETMEVILKICLKHKIPVFFEPTDLKIAGKPFQLPEQLYSAIHYVSPNIYELRTIVSQMGLSNNTYDELDPSTITKEALLAHVKDLSEIVCSKIRKCIVTLGSSGALISTKSTNHYYAVEPITKLVNVSGAGDSFVSGYITGTLKEYPENVCVALGFKAANRALMAKSPVPEQYFQCFDKTVQQCLLENIQSRSI